MFAEKPLFRSRDGGFCHVRVTQKSRAMLCLIRRFLCKTLTGMQRAWRAALAASAAGFFFAAATSSLIEKSSKERCAETDERGYCAYQHDGLSEDRILLLLRGHVPTG